MTLRDRLNSIIDTDLSVLSEAGLILFAFFLIIYVGGWMIGRIPAIIEAFKVTPYQASFRLLLAVLILGVPVLFANLAMMD